MEVGEASVVSGPQSPGVTASGRLKRNCASVSFVTKPAKSPAKKKPKLQAKVTSTSTGEELGDVADKNDWICSFCNQTESFLPSDLILCDGPCLRSFHVSCMEQKPDLVRKIHLCCTFFRN